MSVWRKLPLTAQAAAAYAPRLEDGLPSNTSVRQTQRRGARAEPRQLHAAGLSRGDGLAGDRRRRCARGWAQPARRRRSLMGSRRQLASIVRCSCGGEMPPFVRGGSSAQQTSSPVVSTSMSAQSSGVTHDELRR